MCVGFDRPCILGLRALQHAYIDGKPTNKLHIHKHQLPHAPPDAQQILQALSEDALNLHIKYCGEV
jgi:hypothetical protein